MESFIIKYRADPYEASCLRTCIIVVAAVIIFCLPASAQKVAVLTPDNAERSSKAGELLSRHLAERLLVLDESLAHSAYASVMPATPFNLTNVEGRKIGEAIGCDAFLVLRAATQRRSAFGRPDYYESYAVIYVVSSRTGRLILWSLPSYESVRAQQSEALFSAAMAQVAREIAARIKSSVRSEIDEPEKPRIEEMPDENSPLAVGFRAPVPYRRVKPEYTLTAALYEVTATVDALVDIDAAGSIERIEIVRWAGFGLDESVEAAIRRMNWRAAERKGKQLAMRILL